MKATKRFLLTLVALFALMTGAWAQAPDTIALTPSADGTVWTLSPMPEYDIELDVTYYTDAELDQLAADEVIAKITAIGTVTYTEESKALIDAARTAYDALTDAQKTLVTNYDVLTTAETTYAAAEEAAYTAGVELTKNADGTWTLAKMPGFDVELEVEYETTYAVNIAEGIENGAISVDPAEAAAGDEVTITATPVEGYELASVSVTGVHEDVAVVVTDGKFTMPAEGVHVFATFQPSSKVVIAHGIATYCSRKNLDFTDEDVRAYIVSAFTPSNGEAVLTRVYDVPAGTGLVLIGENGSYEIPEGNGTTVVSNLLVGVFQSTKLNSVDDANTNFILTEGEMGLGFYPVQDGSTLAAGKAYLPLPTASLPVGNGAAIRLVFEDRGEATFIEGVGFYNGGSKTEKGVYYNLNGQRVGRPTKGGIYILDGKKVYVK